MGQFAKVYCAALAEYISILLPPLHLCFIVYYTCIHTYVHVPTVVLRYTSNYRKSEILYDKRDNFNFNIVNFPYLSSNIPSGPAYGVYISQLVRIGRICSNYTQFAGRHYKLTQRLIHQGFRYSALCIAFRKFAKKYTQVLEKYGCSRENDQ